MNFGWTMIDGRLPKLAIRAYFALIIPFLLATGAVRLLLTEAFLHLEYQRPGFPADGFGFTTADRLEYGPLALRYLFNDAGSEFLAVERLPPDKCWPPAARARGCAMFNASELRHMDDVKSVATALFASALACLATALALLIVSKRKPERQRQIRAGIRLGAHLTITLILTLAALALASWNFAFDFFHDLLFAAGTWRFPYSDTLIRLYPEQLFMDAALSIGAFCLLDAVMILALRSRLDEPVR